MASRQRIQWIEIDIGYCNLVWGVGACTAALSTETPRKCHNTFGTCGALAAFDAGIKTLVLMPDVAGIPLAQNMFPVLNGAIKETESTVNIAGADPTISAFGRRATVEFSCRDARNDDTWLDKYWPERISGAAQTDEAGYRPFDRSTLFVKLKARWPHFAGRACRVFDGWIDSGVLFPEATRHYILTDFETDKPGKAMFKGRDVLDVAGNDRALCPTPGEGKLLDDVTADVGATFTLTPELIGDTYDASGWASIGSEIFTFTRSADVVTLTARGLEGTAASTHAAGETFQQAKRYDAVRADLVAADLLTNFAPVPIGSIPSAAWGAEMMTGAASLILTTTIPKPTAVSDLMAELGLLGLSFWWDGAEQEVGLKTNRPIYDDVTWTVTDSDIVIDGIDLKSRDDRRLTEVVFGTVQIDPMKGLADDNFSRLQYTIDGDAKDPNAFGDSRLKVNNIRWLNAGNDDLIRILSLRYLKRFSATPRHATVTVRRDKYGAVKLADVVFIESDRIVDASGKPDSQAYQVIGKERAGVGLIRLTLQRYFYTGRFGYCMVNGSPTYDLASATQRLDGNFAVDESTLVFSDGTGPYVAV